jgi:hypothetical protein
MANGDLIRMISYTNYILESLRLCLCASCMFSKIGIINDIFHNFDGNLT